MALGGLARSNKADNVPVLIRLLASEPTELTALFFSRKFDLQLNLETARIELSVRKLVYMVMVNLLVNDLKPGFREQSVRAVCLAVPRK
jgi:hypothetical protein